MSDINKQKISKFNLLLIVIIIILIAYIIFISIQNNALQKKNQKPYNFTLLSPGLSDLTIDQFLDQQKTMIVSYKDLKPELIQELNKSRGYYGLYFEDLTTGAWLGINEKEKRFVPASLLKLPTLIAVLKKVENKEINMNDTLILKKEDIDTNSGTLGYKGAGYKITIEGLLIYLTKESDNTAVKTLNSQVLTSDEVIQAGIALGLPLPNEPNQYMAPRDIANIFRSLYLSTYLRRTFSEKALELLSDTDFNTGIPKNLPKDIKVSHKIGFFYNENYYHDCGIVYFPKKPYILCIMSSNSTKVDSDRVMSESSKIIYDFIKNETVS